ncbi:MAG: hypothetical protein KGD74_12085 [Candidatus Lokiarchaeota archaeon]|nr:hypothetical protein [Candidatus Lokiarchaeota archaeon]
MILEIIEKELPILTEKTNPYLFDDDFDYSNAIIPFSDFFHRIELLDVYSGNEKIPFKERDSEYKKILLTEFL